MDSVIMTTPGNGPRLRSRLRSAANAICARSSKSHIHHTFPKISTSHQNFNRHKAIAIVFSNSNISKSSLPKSGSISTGNLKKSLLASDANVKTSTAATNSNKSAKQVTDSNVEDVETVPSPVTTKCGRESTRCFQAKLSREAQEVWISRVGPPHRRAPADSLQALFNDLNLYPSKAQVFEMLVLARQSARRVDLTLAFGEFCFLAAQLRRHTLKNTLSTKGDSNTTLPHQDSKNNVTSCQLDNSCKKQLLRSQSDIGSQQESQQQHPYEVFLGGSCNPTTWRSDVAIPTLEKMGITYFNPQVADWSLELIEIEHRAKQSARVLFFVMDADTRAAAAAVEAAHLSAAPRPLVLVLQPYRRGQRIGGEVVSDQEYLDLSRGQAILQEVAERRNLPVFTELPPALRYTYQLLRGGRPYNPNATTPSVATHLKKARDAFDAADEGKTGKLTPLQTVTVLQTYTGVELSLAHVENLIQMLMSQSKEHKTPETSTTTTAYSRSSPRGEEQGVTFELFCLLVAEVTEEMDVVTTETKFTSSRSSEDVPGAMGSRRIQSASGRTYSRRREQQQIHIGSSGSNNSSSSGGGGGGNVQQQEAGGVGGPGNNTTQGLAKGRKLSVIIPKVPIVEVSGSVLTPQSTSRLEGLAGSVRDEPLIRDVYLGGSCIVRTSWREDTVIPMLKEHNLTYHKPEMNDYNRIFSAPPYTPANGGKFSFDGLVSSNGLHRQNSNNNNNNGKNLSSFRSTSKHERSPNATYEGDQPEKKPKYSSRESSPSHLGEGDSNNISTSGSNSVEVRRKDGPYPLQSDNRLSASDFYKIPDNVTTPDPFRGMFDERQVLGSRVLLFGVTGDTRCLSPMVLASHCIGLRPRAVVLCVQLLQHTDGLSERAVKDYNRGRLYLKDLAMREGVPVFDNLEEAAHCVIRKLNNGDY